MITGIIQEEWRSINAYANYQVSNIGTVRNIKNERILTPSTSNKGYLVISLYKTGIRQLHLVHRLVAQEFLENPENKTDVDHIDHNKQNNCINSLRYVSKSENQMNREKLKKSSSMLKGINFHKNTGNGVLKFKPVGKHTHWVFCR